MSTELSTIYVWVDNRPGRRLTEVDAGALVGQRAPIHARGDHDDKLLGLATVAHAAVPPEYGGDRIDLTLVVQLNVSGRQLLDASLADETGTDPARFSIGFQWFGPGDVKLVDLYPSPDTTVPPAARVEAPELDRVALREELDGLYDALVVANSEHMGRLGDILDRHFPEARP